MPKVKKGHSAGEYKNELKHGVSNQFQTSWLKENDRHLWLEEHGLDVDGVYKAGCKWCGNKFNCHLGIIKQHEATDKHQNKEKEYQQAAAGRDRMRQQLEAMQRRAETFKTSLLVETAGVARWGWW